ncbi:MAG: thioredoxin family protein [Pseudobacteriovorax sp.]|nr:thioredoxin family protein [Pseudobacteriovorax sp.]
MASLFRYLFVFINLISIPLQSSAQIDLGSSAPKDLDIKPTDVIIWSAVQADVYPNNQIEVGLRLETKQNFTIYSQKLSFSGPEGTTLLTMEAPDTRRQADPLGDEPVDVYWGGNFQLTFSALDSFSGASFPVTIKFLGCTERICLFPYEQTIEVPAYPAEHTQTQETETESSSNPTSTQEATPDVTVAPKIEKANPSSITDFSQAGISAQLSAGTLPLWIMLIAVFLGGLATNLTPCVFPMIPITIRLLSQEAGSKKGSILYASGIVLTYTAIGSIVSLTGGLFGALLANPIVNSAFAILFILLGLSMLGFANFSKLQAIGSRLGSGGKRSSLNTFLMGAGAGLVAAPCTGPILGGLLIYSAKLDSPQLSTALFFLYSLGFGIPYVFLGMAAGKVSSIKISPKIQVGVKVAFAAVMFGLALFYLKTPAYQVLKPVAGLWSTIAYATLGGFIAVSFITAVFLKNWSHKGLQVLPSAVLGVSIFAFSQVITGTDLSPEIDWLKSEPKAYKQAKETGKPILVDGWAEWCVVCKEMDATIFRDPNVVEELEKHWVILKLDLTVIDDKSEALVEKYKMPGLPTLVLVPSNGDLSSAKILPGARSAESLLEELQGFR